MHKYLPLGCLLFLHSIAAQSAPTVSGNTLSWPDDGWYQVQDKSTYAEVCAGGRSCTVSPGTYTVINHSKDLRFENIVVSGSSGRSSTATVNVTGNTISWPDDGWYQVQRPSDYSEVCGGGRSCTVPAGTYTVINHSKNLRFRNIVVPNGNTPTVTQPSVTPPASSSQTVVVSGQRISWPDDGDWYQVQRKSDYSEVCGGGTSCNVPPGTYNVINHSKNKRYNNIVVGAGASSVGLSELPSPPFTNPPGDDSEPSLITKPVTTITDFLPVQNPGRSMVDTVGILTDDDFNAGLLPSIPYRPDNVSPAENGAPYFVNLDNVVAVAGQELNIVFDPDDPDGGVPGQYPSTKIDGSRFIDNFDGTRSLIWRPLEPDVGIREFTVTAVDAIEPLLRTEQTIRIKVVLPDDLSTIENRPPGINLLKDATVRKGDPVVAYIKVTDPNGTVPSLTLLQAPPGTTVTRNPAEPNFSFLHFVPQQSGTLTLELLARDAIDPSLTATATVKFEVLDNDGFKRPGRRLRDLADDRGLLFGYAAIPSYYKQPDGGIYASIAGEEFNFVTTENSLKWDTVNPLPGQFQWASTDNLVEQAKFSNQKIHGHTLVWYTQVPQWVRRTPITTRETHMREYIDRVLSRYSDDIEVWDVVNEAFEDDGTYRNSIWYEAMGESHIDIAFRQARLSAPDSVLLYNDYDISYNGPKAEANIALLRRLKSEGVPIDGAGFQMHLEADFDEFDEVASIFSRVADIGLDIYITEFDVRILDGQTEEQQARVYEGVLDACLKQPRCKAFQIWGFTDKYTWRSSETTPLILDERFQAKPAYLALQRRLQQFP